MKQDQFIQRVIEKVKDDQNVVGLAVAGSFITNELDEFSDVDLILVTVDNVSSDFSIMESYAKSFGHYLSGFTGEHVGEKRVLICLYDKPLLHVDIKFLTLDEFRQRIENPIIVFDRDQSLKRIMDITPAEWPKLDFQWVEDRFWTWVHYAALKLGRGENFEALEFLSFLRTTIISPLLQMKNGKLPRGVRKVEMTFPQSDVELLAGTVPLYDTNSLFIALGNAINLYILLRRDLFPEGIHYRAATEKRSMEYLAELKKKKIG